MMSLFDSFDPSHSSGLIYLFLFVIFSISLFSTLFSVNIQIISALSKFFLLYLSLLSSEEKSKIFSFFCFSMLTGIFLANFLSILPFNFTTFSQVSSVLFMSLFVWGSGVLFNVSKSSKSMIIHWVPLGSPLSLSWFLFIVEIVSMVIRPLTLSIRLMANLVAGHLLLSLNFSLLLNFFPAIISFFLLNVLEIFVCFIQSYIFMTLAKLYHND